MIPPQRDRAAALPADPAVRVLRRLRGDAEGAGPERRRHRSGAVQLSVQTFDPWFVGVIGAAGVLTALVPGSMILMSAATLLANNLYRPLHRTAADRRSSAGASCWCRCGAGRGAVHACRAAKTIVALLLMGYSFVTQLFPALVLSLRTATPWATPRGRRRRHRRRRRDGRRRQPDAHHHRHAVSGFAGGDAGAQCRADCACGERDRAGCRRCGREAGDGAVAFTGQAHRPLSDKARPAPTGPLCQLDKPPLNRRTLQATSLGRKNMRLAVCGFTALVLLALPAHAEMSGGKIKIGVLTDLSGPLRAEFRRRLGRGREDGRRGVRQQDQRRADRDRCRRSPEQARRRRRHRAPLVRSRRRRRRHRSRQFGGRLCGARHRQDRTTRRCC